MCPTLPQYERGGFEVYKAGVPIVYFQHNSWSSDFLQGHLRLQISRTLYVEDCEPLSPK